MSSSESELHGFEVLSDLDLDLDVDLVDAPHYSDPDDALEITSDRTDQERYLGFEAEHDDRPDWPSEPSASYPLEIIGIDSDSMPEHVDSVASGSRLTAREESDWEEAFGGAVGAIEQAMASLEQGEPLRDLDQEFSFGFHPEVAQRILRNEIARRGNSPASASVVENLPLITVSKEGLGTGDGVCPICKDKFVEGEKVKVLPCVHRYHQDCILPWLRMHNTCPVCRFELPKDDLRLGIRRTGRDGVMNGGGLHSDTPI
ncbi:hypothetical protein BT93_J0900 [Corymbia citriodora subsp. variegata]|nr:hypothetical protein BT93_J0900 [Corymbia citriodora subsp. variegata]KAF8010075.1 hypothetical protein BT93_J0900 [Corymbia citriodora subsp. variegata]